MDNHVSYKRTFVLIGLGVLAGFFGGYGVANEIREPGYLGISIKPDTAQEARADTIRQLGDSVKLSVSAADSIRVDTVKIVIARSDSARLTIRLDSLLTATDSITRAKVEVAIELARAAARAPLLATIEQRDAEVAALRQGVLFGRRRHTLLEVSLNVERERANALAAENMRLKGRIAELRTQRVLTAGAGFLSGATFGFFAAR